MSVLRCPICHHTLVKQEKCFRCTQAHTFDRARQGYVNLIRSQKKIHGDNSEMVMARTRFLQGGYYEPLKNQLLQILSQFNPQSVLDCGCGEGYYTQLQEKLATCEFYGVDLSKEALKVASRIAPQVQFIAASVFDLPFFDESFDFLWSCFAPTQITENSRVLKKDGILVIIGPGQHHLWQLKEVLYEKPYLNEIEELTYPDFTHLNTLEVTDTITLNSNQAIQDLFTMTPYYYKTSFTDKKKLEHLTSLTTQIDFLIHVYRKK